MRAARPRCCCKQLRGMWRCACRHTARWYIRVLCLLGQAAPLSIFWPCFELQSWHTRRWCALSASHSSNLRVKALQDVTFVIKARLMLPQQKR